MLVIVKGIKMKILLTGSTGFIGSYVLKYLIYEGQSVNVLVRDKSKIFNSNHPGLNI
ncbi:MAG: GDP-mannose 4,6-dehydratase, partial [Ignavibacteriaceae bacterium]|nr:GDP-mannose 4,6-dehydratase [Ignavibacteriaceae bacterium]